MALPLRLRLLVSFLQVIWTAFAFFGFIIAVITHPLTAFKKKSRTVPPKILHDSSFGTHEYVTINGVKFHYVTAGDKTKPFMLFLHGFPEFWFSWRFQLKELQKHFNVFAVDMRGYGESEKPIGVHNYTIPILKQDVVELIKELGGGRKCTLVAHDWGGVIAWRVVQRNPEMIERFVVLNCPHPKVYRRAIAKGWKQLNNSWYMFFFQTPKLPELVISFRDLDMFNQMYRGKMGLKNSQNFTDEIIEAYKYTYGQPGALTPPINYYRNLFNGDTQGRSDTGSSSQVSTPTLLIWGEDDAVLSLSMVDDHKPICENLTIRRVPNCSHFVQQDRPDLVNQYIQEFAGVKEADE